MQIPRIARLHADVGAEAVGLRIDLVRLGRVLQLLQDVAGAHAPAVVLDDDVGGRVVVRLQAVFGLDVGGEIGGGEVGVLAAGLDVTIQSLEAGKDDLGFWIGGKMLCMWMCNDLPQQSPCPIAHSNVH